MKRKIYLFFEILFGILGTIGGWYMFLLMLGLVPDLTYTIPSLIIMFCGVATILAASLFGGPLMIKDAIETYRCNKELEPTDCFED